MLSHIAVILSVRVTFNNIWTLKSRNNNKDGNVSSNLTYRITESDWNASTYYRILNQLLVKNSTVSARKSTRGRDWVNSNFSLEPELFSFFLVWTELTKYFAHKM